MPAPRSRAAWPTRRAASTACRSRSTARLYLDEGTVERSAAFAGLRATIRALTRHLAALARA
jgi:hypothetical protein